MKPQLDLLLDAVSFAARAHQGQFRKDGRTPYASHPTRVCLVMRCVFGVEDPEVLAAAVLHDTIEDTIRIISARPANREQRADYLEGSDAEAMASSGHRGSETHLASRRSRAFARKASKRRKAAPDDDDVDSPDGG